MIEPKTITIDGMEFNLRPLPIMKALKLDKRVVTILLPVLGGVKEFSLDAKVDLKTMADGVAESLSRMENKDFEELVIDLLSGVIYLEPGKGAQEITLDIINRIFQGKLSTVYKLMFEVMKFNKFSPFELVAGGNVMNKILISASTMQEEKKNGNKLEKSGNLLEN